METATFHHQRAGALRWWRQYKALSPSRTNDMTSIAERESCLITLLSSPRDESWMTGIGLAFTVRSHISPMIFFFGAGKRLPGVTPLSSSSQGTFSLWIDNFSSSLKKEMDLSREKMGIFPLKHNLTIFGQMPIFPRVTPTFLYASLHLYKSVCPSVRPLVGRSVMLCNASVKNAWKSFSSPIRSLPFNALSLSIPF